MAFRIYHGMMLLGAILLAYGIVDAAFLTHGFGIGIGIAGLGFIVLGWLIQHSTQGRDPAQIRRDNVTATQSEIHHGPGEHRDARSDGRRRDHRH